MYSIDDNEGNLIETGIDERIAQRVAHDYADRLGQPVWLYLSPIGTPHAVLPEDK
jgi:hypothetical protein